MLHFSFAYRYLRAKKSANAINIISWVSVAAIALGTAALVLVMSVFNGFENMVKQLYGTFYTDIKILPAKGKFATITPQQLKQMASINGIKGLSPVIEERVILQNGPGQSIVSLKGVDENYTNTSGISSSVFKGKFNVGTEQEPQLVLGAGVEMALGTDAVNATIPITVYLPKQSSSVTLGQSDLGTANLYPSGAFAIQDEFNNKYAFSHIGFMRTYMGLPADSYSGVELSVKNIKEEEQVRDQLEKLLGSTFKVETRYQQNKVLYAAMRLEKWFIYGVLVLIMVIFSFTIISALSMLVIEKQKDISVLKAMGADHSFIRKIFMSEGFLLSGIGGLVGLSIALVLCFLQLKFKFIKLYGNSFLIDYYPVKVLPSDLLLIVLTVFFISLFAAWIPAMKAGNRPVELRGAD